MEIVNQSENLAIQPQRSENPVGKLANRVVEWVQKNPDTALFVVGIVAAVVFYLQ